MKPCILAIDIGTSGVKLLLLNIETGRIDTVTEGYPTLTPAPGYAEQNPNDWWQAVCRSIPRLLSAAQVRPEQIGAIGVDGVSWTPVMLNAQGQVLTNAPLWYDTRSSEQCHTLREQIGEDRVFDVSGNPLQPYYLLPKYLWFAQHHPDIIRQTRHILTSNGYIAYRLTSCLTQDECQAYGWAFYHMADGYYDEQMAEDAGFDLSLLPAPKPCIHVGGTVTRAAASECGLCEGIPVIIGGLDAACGALGAGVYQSGPLHEQSGSAGGMSICTDTCQKGRGLILSRHVVPGKWLLQGGTVGGGNLVRWLTDTLGASRDDLNTLAESISPGSEGLIFLPYMAGERSPIWNPHATGVFFGLDYSKTKGHMMRAVLEGAAFSLRHNLEIAAQAGVHLDEMRAVGGASRNELWMQIKADVTNQPIRAVSSPDATAIGCAMLAGVGSGMLTGFDAVNSFVQPHEKVFIPIPEHSKLYHGVYAQYLELYERLNPMMKG